jgi:hypothetical protein
MSELVSVTSVPPAGAAPLSVTVHVADPPLPPAMIEGLHAKELTVCAYARDGTSVHVMKLIPIANADRFAAPRSLTRHLLSTARGGTSGRRLARADCKPAAAKCRNEFRRLSRASRNTSSSLRARRIA